MPNLVPSLRLAVFVLGLLIMGAEVRGQQNANSSNNPQGNNKGKEDKDGSGANSRNVTKAAFCPTKAPVEYFFVDFSGNVSNTGRTFEGPLCIVVFFNPIAESVGIESTTTTVAGPDLTKVVPGGNAAGGAQAQQTKEGRPQTLPAALKQLAGKADALTTALRTRAKNYGQAAAAADQAISGVAQLRQTTALLNGKDAFTAIRNGYIPLRGLLTDGSDTSVFVPSDRPDKLGDVLLADAQAQEDRLNALPLEFIEGAPANFECDSDVKVGWSTWLAKCKDAVYTPLKAILDANLQAAKDLASDADNTKALIKKIATVQYWDARFSTLGLRKDMTVDQVNGVDMNQGYYVSTFVRCGLLFNQTSNTAVNIVTADLTPTLQGSDPTVKAQSAFVTVSCGTPFAVSAGIGFHTIEQKQFAIVQSPDGKGGVMNTFGTTSDSKITPVALALVHVRLSEWSRHKVGFYGSLGVGGSLQNQTSSSPVQFLPGISVSFWRTMYITAGPEIGNRTTLTGGFKEGDPVPPAVTNINSVTKSSFGAGFGFAISFTKPS